MQRSRYQIRAGLSLRNRQFNVIERIRQVCFDLKRVSCGLDQGKSLIRGLVRRFCGGIQHNRERRNSLRFDVAVNEESLAVFGHVIAENVG